MARAIEDWFRANEGIQHSKIPSIDAEWKFQTLLLVLLSLEREGRWYVTSTAMAA